MSQEHHSRRGLLKSAVAASTFGTIAMATPGDAFAAGPGTDGMAGLRAGIDTVLRRAVDAREVPGVVAMAATDRGVFYEGTFGTRNLASGPMMTPDTVFRIASMTKAVTSVAAMQLVEQGKLRLDDPVPNIDPALGTPQVLEGFDASGAPRLRAARRPITLKHLLTHTAGFSYEQWDANTTRYVKATGMPSTSTGKIASLRMPLAFDPGERWEYGVNIDWVGLLVEAASGQKLDAYFREHIFGPLGMKDTGFATTPEQRARQVSVHQRQADGSLEPQPLETQFTPEFWAGGGGLYSTATDYMAFLQALLHEGSFNGARILRPETVALMGRNHVGDIEAGILKTTNPQRSVDVDFFPGASLKWGLGYMINAQAGPNGRSAGSLTWAGIFNTHYWIDPVRRVTGLIMTQVLPFGDPQTMTLYGQFERAVYDYLRAA
ncbi:serine hydrolase domain-containing protein [Paracraurococcus lichenis]|uniref:Serine hydrolase domain-containing protein n=1 Tax=Paracraurococcus lichenis TaxID=3064888 RepID=A0ABT9EDT0_9PROT|nr:serine hydrolase domain-containing protein [Paracraurococcus sp. LOR1-02]MDO9714128.1 serine hydrolase domain-containing protein [Paracraurococcus sp. LOR1-02]